MKEKNKKTGSGKAAAGVALALLTGMGAVCPAAALCAYAETDADGTADVGSVRTVIPDISSINGLYLHFDAQTESGEEGGISVMANKGSGGNAVQSDTAGQPRLVRSSNINGYPAYRFESDSFMTVENSADKYVENMTVYTVAYASELPDHGEILSRVNGAPYDHNWFYNIESGMLNFGWGTRLGSGLSYPQNKISIQRGTPLILGAEKDGSRASMYVNALTAASFAGMPTPCDPHGAPITVGGSSDSFIGDIGEILFFDRTLTYDENVLVEQYLETRWGMKNLHDGMLTGICVNGTPLTQFRPEKTDYTYLTETDIDKSSVTYTKWNDADSAVVTETATGFAIEVTSAATNKKRIYTLDVKMRNYDYNEIERLTSNEVKINDGFWSGLYKQYSVHTVNFMFDMFDMSKSFDNFDRVADGEKKVLGNTSDHAAQILKPRDDRHVYNTDWEWINEPWREGLIYEGIRAAAEFIIVNKSDPEYAASVAALRARLDGYVGRIYDAALKTTAKDGNGKPIDGYFSTFNILDQRFVCDESEVSGRYHHDIYNYGCLAEAAVYMYNATGDTRLLFAATRFTEFLIDYINGRDGFTGYKVVPPHQLPEEALQRMYDLYKNDPSLVRLMQDRYSYADGLSSSDRYYKLEIRLDKYAKIAASWITDRGNYEGRYNFTNFGPYAQDNVDYTELTDATGHAVRANLWYNGIAYIGNRQQRGDFVAAAERVWRNIVDTQMYITGGTGSTHDSDEAYGGSHELPHDGYCETCASVGMAFFGQNMFYLFGEAEYADTVELEMYNGILGCLGLDGNSFYYTNPLVSDNYTRPMFSNATPCCVPMFLKFFSELPEIIYAKTDDTVFVNQYVSSSLQTEIGGKSVIVVQDTDMPNGSTAAFSARADKAFKLKLRMPSWASKAQVTVNGVVSEASVGADGYIDITVDGNAEIRVEFTKQAMIVTQDHAQMNVGKAAFRYGPFIYCAEDADNMGLRDAYIKIPDDAEVTVEYDETTFEYSVDGLNKEPIGVNILKINSVNGSSGSLTLIPFYLRGNRDVGYMRVWFDKVR